MYKSTTQRAAYRFLGNIKSSVYGVSDDEMRGRLFTELMALTNDEEILDKLLAAAVQSQSIADFRPQQSGVHERTETSRVATPERLALDFLPTNTYVE